MSASIALLLSPNESEVRFPEASCLPPGKDLPRPRCQLFRSRPGRFHRLLFDRACDTRAPASLLTEPTSHSLEPPPPHSGGGGSTPGSHASPSPDGCRESLSTPLEPSTLVDRFLLPRARLALAPAACVFSPRSLSPRRPSAPALGLAVSCSGSRGPLSVRRPFPGPRLPTEPPSRARCSPFFLDRLPPARDNARAVSWVLRPPLPPVFLYDGMPPLRCHARDWFGIRGLLALVAAALRAFFSRPQPTTNWRFRACRSRAREGPLPLE